MWQFRLHVLPPWATTSNTPLFDFPSHLHKHAEIQENNSQTAPHAETSECMSKSGGVVHGGSISRQKSANQGLVIVPSPSLVQLPPQCVSVQPLPRGKWLPSGGPSPPPWGGGGRYCHHNQALDRTENKLKQLFVFFLFRVGIRVRVPDLTLMLPHNYPAMSWLSLHCMVLCFSLPTSDATIFIAAIYRRVVEQIASVPGGRNKVNFVLAQTKMSWRSLLTS